MRWGFALTEIARATLTQYGLTQLYTGYDSQREDLALTPKTAFLLKQLIDSNTRTLGNVIPNSKKSNAVDSNSMDTVATSAAAKKAYDKAVDAKSAADNAQQTANAALPLNNTRSKEIIIGSFKFVMQDDGNFVIAKTATNEIIYAASRWVSKLGDTLSGQLIINSPVGIVRFQNNGVNYGYVGFPSADNNYIRLSSNLNTASYIEIQPEKIVAGKIMEMPSLTVSGAVNFGGKGALTADNNNVYWQGNLLHHSDRHYVEVKTNATRNNKGGLKVIRDDFIAQFEALSDKRWVFWTSNSGYAVYVPAKSGTVALQEDFSYQKIGNFEIRKYPDGTMIQTYLIEQYDLKTWAEKSFSWAQAFISAPMMFAYIQTSYGASHSCGVNIQKKSNNATCYYYEWEVGSTDQGNVAIQFLAIGRWK